MVYHKQCKPIFNYIKSEERPKNLNNKYFYEIFIYYIFVICIFVRLLLYFSLKCIK